MIKQMLIIAGMVLLLAPAAYAKEAPARTPHPSARTVRQNGRIPLAANPQRVSIRSVTLDRTFSDTELGVKIQYPSAWEVNNIRQVTPPLTMVVMLLSPDELPKGIRQNINLVTEDLRGPLTLAEYTEIGIQTEREFFRDFALLSSDDITIAGTYHAHRVRFRSGDMFFQQVWLLKNGRAHVWTFADSTEGFEKHIATFERMLDTLTVR